MSTPPAKPPEILDKIVDIVRAHRRKPKVASSAKIRDMRKGSLEQPIDQKKNARKKKPN